MDSRVFEYCTQHLGLLGFVITTPSYAAQLRPDIFNSQQQAIGLMGDLWEGLKTFGVNRYRVKLVNGEEFECWSKVKEGLDLRVYWVTGLKVLKIDEIKKPASLDHKSDKEIAQDRERIETVKALKKIAVQEPPSHDCHARRDILAAREELVRLGENYAP